MSIFKWVSDIEEVPHKLAAETINSTARGAKNGQEFLSSSNPEAAPPVRLSSSSGRILAAAGNIDLDGGDNRNPPETARGRADALQDEARAAAPPYSSSESSLQSAVGGLRGAWCTGSYILRPATVVVTDDSGSDDARNLGSASVLDADVIGLSLRDTGRICSCSSGTSAWPVLSL
ncbi:hypothetical protein PoMZ_00520 [Pyricularia oryzae]|uniref:Uncharacterized protein n=1 Tax=Pyricularia oryzae TaxID=318829 RepID=A0A4P7N080_PYROR|nr:hypothetical protein PoMZ_00520 [Pyricularia oryzae]